MPSAVFRLPAFAASSSALSGIVLRSRKDSFDAASYPVSGCPAAPDSMR